MSAHTADTVYICLSAIIPIVLIVFFRWKGLIFSILTVWFLGIIAGHILSGLDWERGHTIGDTIWILFGWIGGIIYCLPIFGIRELSFWMYKRHILKQQSIENNQIK